MAPCQPTFEPRTKFKHSSIETLDLGLFPNLPETKIPPFRWPFHPVVWMWGMALILKIEWPNMPKHENHRSRFSDSKPVKKMFKNGLTFEKMMFLCLKCFLVPMYRLPR